MNKPNAIVTHRDDKSYYAADRKSARYLRKRERYEARNERRAQRRSKKAQWSEKKKNLYIIAFSKNREAEAEQYLMNNKIYYSQSDIKKHAEKLQRKHYRKLVKEAKRFR